MVVLSGVVFSGVEIRVGTPGPARQQGAIDSGGGASDRLVEVGNPVVQGVGDRDFDVCDDAGDDGLVHEHQLGDDVLGHVVLEVDEGGFDSLFEGERLPPGGSVPLDAFPDQDDELVEADLVQAGGTTEAHRSLPEGEYFGRHSSIFAEGPLPVEWRHALISL